MQRRERFGLIGWLESTCIQLPLESIQCDFRVEGALLDVCLDQLFVQTDPRALDCLYNFPLPAGAAVYQCEMHVNGRVIRAVVEEQGEARRLVAEQKRAGHRTALVEMERENLFTLSLGNLQTGDTVLIRLRYFQTVQSLGDWRSFHIPFCPGERYIPGSPLLRPPKGKGVSDDTAQVPDASRISPPRLDRGSPDGARVHLSGSVDPGGCGLVDLSSPSHAIVLRRAGRGFEVSLALGETVPDRDLVIRWTERAPEEVSVAGWGWEAGGQSYAMVQVTTPGGAAAVPREPTDYYFLLDHSGSMAGLVWEKAVEALGDFVRSVQPRDRVWITLFDDQCRDYAEAPVEAEVLARDPGLAALGGLGASGGTELLPAVLHAFKAMKVHSCGRRTELVILTDGMVGNEAALLGALRQAPGVAVHMIGIGFTPNDALLQGLAGQSGGTWHQTNPMDDWSGLMRRVARRLGPPFVSRLIAVDGWEEANLREGVLRRGDTLTLLLKGEGERVARGVRLQGTGEDGSVWSCSLPTLEPGTAAVRLAWERTRIQRDLRQGKKPEAIQRAKACNLICDGTAFIAWDDSEKVVVATESVFQPAEHVRFSGGAARSLRLCGAPPAHSLEDRQQVYLGGGTPLAEGPMMGGSAQPAGGQRRGGFRFLRELVSSFRVPELAWLRGLTRSEYSDLSPILELWGPDVAGDHKGWGELLIRLYRLPRPGCPAKELGLWLDILRGLMGWLAAQPPEDRTRHMRSIDTALVAAWFRDGIHTVELEWVEGWVRTTIPEGTPEREKILRAVVELGAVVAPADGAEWV